MVPFIFLSISVHTMDVCTGFSEAGCSYAFNQADSDEKLKRANSITMFNIDDKNVEKSVEYFFASDAR
jgi:hypothetical protein